MVRPRTTTGIRLTTSTRSAARTTSSAPVTSPLSTSRTRPGGSPGAVEGGRLAACRPAERPPLDTFEGLALEDCGRVLVDRFADQGGIWVRIAGSVGAGDHDEARPGGLAHSLGQRLQNPRGIGIA